jgi:hypothetical protein
MDAHAEQEQIQIQEQTWQKSVVSLLMVGRLLIVGKLSRVCRLLSAGRLLRVGSRLRGPPEGQVAQRSWHLKGG